MATDGQAEKDEGEIVPGKVSVISISLVQEQVG